MEREVYRVSRRRMIVVASAAALMLLAVVPMRDDPAAPFVGGVPLALALLWVAWATGLEYRLTTGALVRTTRFGSTTIRWDQLEELWYRGEKRSVNLVPLGTYVTLWLRDRSNEKITISGGGNYFGYLLVAPTDVDTLQDAVLRATATPLANRIRTRVDAGEVVALGAVSLARQNGITIRRLIGSHTVPLANLAGVGVHDGSVYFFERGAKKSLAPIAVAQVANAGPLVAVLEGLGVPQLAMVAGFLRPKVG